jgi:TRAP-type C4-dicarboxylate transport system permease small subunit
MHSVSTTVRWLDKTLIVIASMGLLLMMVHITLDVIADLVFNAPLPLTSVYVTDYYMICVAFLPLFITEYRNGHISVDMFVKYLPDGLRRALGWLVQAVFIFVYVILAAQSWEQFTAKLAINAYVMEQTSRVIA